MTRDLLIGWRRRSATGSSSVREPSPTPVQSFTRYDIVFENGEVRWVPSETDLLIEALTQEMFEGERTGDG
jgi:hypothetical protein